MKTLLILLKNEINTTANFTTKPRHDRYSNQEVSYVKPAPQLKSDGNEVAVERLDRQPTVGGVQRSLPKNKPAKRK